MQSVCRGCLQPGDRVGIGVASDDMGCRATEPGGELCAVHCPVGISDRTTTAHQVVHMRTTDSKTPVGWAGGRRAVRVRGRARVQGSS